MAKVGRGKVGRGKVGRGKVGRGKVGREEGIMGKEKCVKRKGGKAKI